jgi:hypothetical protein
MVADAIRCRALKNEEPTLGGDDIPFPKKAVVHDHVRGDAFGLDGVRGVRLIRPCSCADAVAPEIVIEIMSRNFIRLI